MFGLTKREQRWKAEQAAATLLVDLTKSILGSRVVEAVQEIDRLKAENAELKRALEQTK